MLGFLSISQRTIGEKWLILNLVQKIHATVLSEKSEAGHVVQYLLQGLSRYGPSWARILVSTSILSTQSSVTVANPHFSCAPENLQPRATKAARGECRARESASYVEEQWGGWCNIAETPNPAHVSCVSFTPTELTNKVSFEA